MKLEEQLQKVVTGMADQLSGGMHAPVDVVNMASGPVAGCDLDFNGWRYRIDVRLSKETTDREWKALRRGNMTLPMPGDVEVSLKNRDPVDFKGLPTVVDGRAKWDVAADAETPDPKVMAAVMDAVLSGKIKLPPIEVRPPETETVTNLAGLCDTTVVEARPRRDRCGWHRDEPENIRVSAWIAENGAPVGEPLRLTYSAALRLRRQLDEALNGA